MSNKHVSLDERFSGLSQAKSAAQSLAGYWEALNEAEPANDEEKATVERWKARTDRALNAVRTVDPILFDGPLATAVKQHADAAANHLKSNGISGPNTPDTADTLHRTLLDLVPLPAAGKAARPLAHVTDDAVALVQNLQQHVADLTEQVEALQEERGRLTAEMEERIAQADATVTGHTERLASQVTAEIDRVTAQLEDDRREFVRARHDHDDEAEQLISTLKQKVSLAADGSLSVGYDNAAAAEEKSADTLRTWAVVFAVASALLAVAAVWLSGSDSDWSGWDMAPVKLAAVAAPAAIATYLGRESSGHRSEAWRLRQVRLELSNLGEYLSELTPEQRTEVRKVLVARYFASDAGQPGATDGFSPLGQMLLAQLGGTGPSLPFQREDSQGQASASS